MKCYLHNEADAVAKCSCGKGLCNECLQKYNIPICQQCVEASAENELKEKTKPVVITGVIAVIGFIFMLSSDGNIIGALMGTWAVLGFYWGWSLVRPMLMGTALGTFLFGSAGFILGIIAVFASAVLGMFIGPFLLIKNIIDYKKSKAIRDQIVSKS
jgi:hypothetical protein